MLSLYYFDIYLFLQLEYLNLLYNLFHDFHEINLCIFDKLEFYIFCKNLLILHLDDVYNLYKNYLDLLCFHVHNSEGNHYIKIVYIYNNIYLFFSIFNFTKSYWNTTTAIIFIETKL